MISALCALFGVVLLAGTPEPAVPAPDTLPGAAAPADASLQLEDATAQELLPVQSVLAFLSVGALATGGAGSLAGLWLSIATSPVAYFDGKLRDPPLAGFFHPQGDPSTALLGAMLAAAVALPAMGVALAALMATALTHILAMLDARGRTPGKLALRAGTAAALAACALLPLWHLVGAALVLPPLAAAWTLYQVAPQPPVSATTAQTLPWVVTGTAALHAGTLLLWPLALGLATVAAVGVLPLLT
ncbi:MAG: hypothetical protein HY904_18945 [Deltaproteobacteria bacterium]|nr:hypothetical protein [Deltaproteobacteria bacterium]